MEGSIPKTLDHVLFLSRHFHRDDMDSLILAILLELHIPSSADGFQYLRKSIAYICRNPQHTYLSSVYDVVAPDCGSLAVAQAIHRAILKGRQQGNPVYWDYYFPADCISILKCPSNSMFIFGIARVVELWLCCTEEVAHELS